MDIEVESLAANVVSGILFEGDLAVVNPEIPEGLQLLSAPSRYELVATRPGRYRFGLDLNIRVRIRKPNWNGWRAPRWPGRNRTIRPAR